MFRKIVSNLSFSPALVGQLGFYAKRLKKEEATRRLGLVFVALALVVQCLSVFQPPESANASNPNDFIPGGLGIGTNSSAAPFIAAYDRNDRNLKDVMTYLGITRSEIVGVQYGTFITGSKLSWGFEPRPGSTTVNVTNASGAQVTSVYAKPMSIANGTGADINGWIGHSAKVGWFALMNACGNLVTDVVPPPPPPPPPPPTPPVKPPVTPPVKPPVEPPVVRPPADVVLSKSAKNISQGNVKANSVTAKENDKITYTITAENKGGTAKVTKLSDNIGDVLEYSTLIDKGGGTLNASGRVLSWPDVNLKPGEKQSRTFAVQLLSTIPATPAGASDPTSYNCLMENVFGNDYTISVTCAPPKVIEQVTTELPKTGPTENMIFAGVVLAVVTYFFLRSKQLGKEVRLIRRDLNAGTI